MSEAQRGEIDAQTVSPAVLFFLPGLVAAARRLRRLTETLGVATEALRGRLPLSVFASADRVAAEGARLSIGSDIIEHLPGGEFRRYRVQSILSGGISMVYLVIDPDSRETFAIKENRLTPGSNHKKDERLAHEGEILRAIGPHPNIVRYQSAFTYRNRQCLVLGLAPNGTLEGYLEHCDPDIGELIRLAGQLCDAVQFSRERLPGFVHGDIKPGNCLLDRDLNLQLGDFGMATCDGLGDRRGSKKKPGGTNAYMAPELFGDVPPDRGPADVYAFGATLFEMLTGERFDARRDRNVAQQDAHRSNLTASLAAAETPPELADLVLECVAVDPGARPADFSDIAARLLPFAAPRNEIAASPKHPKSARRFFRKILNFMFLNGAVEQELINQRPHRATRILDEMLEIDPWLPATHEKRAAVARQIGRHEDALELLKGALDDGVFSPRIFYETARLELEFSRPAQAIILIQKAVREKMINGEFGQLFANACRQLVANERLAHLADLESQTVSFLESHENPLSNAVLAQILAVSELPQRAVSFTVFGPFISGAENGSARLTSDEIRAIIEISRHKETDDLFDVVHVAGRLLYECNEFDACREVFSEALLAGRSTENALYYLGSLDEIAGELPTALEFYRRAQELNQDCLLIGTGIRRVTAKIAAGLTNSRRSSDQLNEVL